MVMIPPEINKIECNLHELSSLEEVYKRIAEKLAKNFSLQQYNFLILIYGYRNGEFLKENVRSYQFAKNMEITWEFKLYRYTYFEKDESTNKINEGLTAF